MRGKVEEPRFQTQMLLALSAVEELREKVGEMSCEFLFDTGLDDEQKRLIPFFQRPSGR